jgi:hypothetical protein
VAVFARKLIGGNVRLEILLGEPSIFTAERSSGRRVADQLQFDGIRKEKRWVHLQLLSRTGAQLDTLIRTAIAHESIKSFEVARVKGGLRIRHKKHLGEVRFSRTPGPLLATLVCKNRSKEWQLLEAFVGRLSYHFKNDIAAINIQFEPQDDESV